MMKTIGILRCCWSNINGLNIRPDGIYIDGTFGRGGHSRLILSQLGEEGRLLAIDRDPQAIAVAKTIDDPRFSIIHGPFSALGEYVAERDLIGKIDGILSIPASSPQLDAEARLSAHARWSAGHAYGPNPWAVSR